MARGSSTVLGAGAGRVELTRLELLKFIRELVAHADKTRPSGETGISLAAVMKQTELFGDEEGRRYPFPIHGETMIVLTGECLLRCPCGAFGKLELRRMGNGEIRNQPRCQACRGGSD